MKHLDIRMRSAVSAVVFVLSALFIFSIVTAASASAKQSVVVILNSNIDGGAVLFVERVLKSVSQTSRTVLILELNSYGGYLYSADRIIEYLLANNVECYVWIPPGGKAVSAAALIALACSDIYMAPGSNFGGMKPYPEDEKVVSYVESRATSLIARRINVSEEIASVIRSMVRNGASYDASTLYSIGLAKRADTLDEVVRDINATIVRIVQPTPWERLISLISNTVVSSLLLGVGVLLILAEIFTTGFQGYAVAGIILIVLGLYGMQLVQPDIVTLSLILSGAVLLAIEIFTPGFGAFGITGALLLTLGLAIGLYYTPPQLITPSLYVVIGGVLSIAALFLFIMAKAAQTFRMRKPSLRETLIGSIGIAKTDIAETTPGVAYVQNEEWTAYSVRGTIEAGSKVRVVNVDGLKLYVEKVESDTN